MTGSPQYHFLDANVIVGDVVEWDTQRRNVLDYMERVSGSHSLYTSYRACRESEGVIERQRQQALKAAKAIFEEFDPGKAFDPLSGVEGFVRSKFNWDDHASTIEYIHSNKQLFRDLAQQEGKGILRNHLRVIGDEYKTCYKKVGTIKHGNSLRTNLFDQTYNDYTNIEEYDNKIRILDACVEYDPDRDVLLDAECMIERGLTEKIAFVTLDEEHILTNASEIEAALPGVRIFDAGTLDFVN